MMRNGETWTVCGAERTPVDEQARRVTSPGPEWCARKGRPIPQRVRKGDVGVRKHIKRLRELKKRLANNADNPHHVVAIGNRIKRRVDKIKAARRLVVTHSELVEPKKYKDRGSDRTVLRSYLAKMDGKQRTRYRALVEPLVGVRLSCSVKAAVARLVRGMKIRPQDEALLKLADERWAEL